MEKRLLLLLNPCAGQRRANRALAEILRIFLDAGYRCETYVTAARGDAERFAAQYASEFDRIVCVGGDGTLNETIAGLLRSGASVPLGYIPAGSTNDYAASLGLSSNLLTAVRDAVKGEPRLLDVGSFNGRYFTYTACCGAFTRASYNTSQSMKNMLGHLAYILGGIKDLPSLHPYHLRVEANDGVIEDDFLFCAVTNSTSVAGILKLDAQRVALNDGKFEVMLVRNPTTAIQLSNIIRAITAMDLPCEMVHFFTADHICIDCAESIEWTLDGEHEPGAARVEMRNLHSAVRVVTPAQRADGETEA